MKKFFRQYWPSILGGVALLIPFFAFGQDPSDVLETVAGPLDGGIGGAEFGGIFEFLAWSSKPLFYIFGFLIVVRAGFILVTEQDDEQAARSRRAILGVITIIILINLAPAIRDALLGIETQETIPIVRTELLGLIEWFEVLIGVVAVAVIIVSGIRAIVAWGSEEGLAQLRRTVFAVLTGIVLIVFKYTLCGSIISGNPSTGICEAGFLSAVYSGGIIGTMIYVFNVILSFTALVAVAMVIYAGFLMVANIGNDEQYTRAKMLILRVAIGILVIIASGALVNIIAGIAFGAPGVTLFG